MASFRTSEILAIRRLEAVAAAAAAPVTDLRSADLRSA
jgi:hypothetical protein